MQCGRKRGVLVALAFMPRIIAQTNWGLAPGWQREIGFWNLGMLIDQRRV